MIWIRLDRYCDLYERAGDVEKRCQRAHWVKGKHFRPDPDGKMWINLPEVRAWIEGGEIKTDEPFPWVGIEKYCEHYGETPAAIRMRVKRGQWQEWVQYKKDPLGKMWVNPEGVRLWIES